MTALGKLLVFLNVFAAVGLLAWAVSAHANRVDWLDAQTAEGQAVEGRISKMKKEIADLTAAAGTGSARYGVNNAVLLRTEAVRDRRAYVLARRLDQARNGSFYEYPRDPANGLLDDVSPRQYQPILYRGQPLRGVAAVQADLERETATIQQLIEGTREFDQPAAAAVAQAAGGPDLPAAVEGFGIVGLRKAFGVVSDRVAVVDDATRKQRDILVNLREEAAFLKDARVNWVAQLQTLDRRHQQLQVRLAPFAAPPKDEK